MGGWTLRFLLVFAMSYVRDPARFDPLPRPKCMVLQVLVFRWLHMDRREVSEASVRGWAPWYALGGPRTVAGMGGWTLRFLLVFAMSYVRDPARFDPPPPPKCMVLQVLVFQWLHMDRREVSEASVRGWAPWYALGGPRTVAGMGGWTLRFLLVFAMSYTW